MTELTYVEFCLIPFEYRFGVSGDWGAQRSYRNDEFGVWMSVNTKRKRYGDIYSGWKDGVMTFTLDGDEREFKTTADLYVAYMEKVCGVKEEA